MVDSIINSKSAEADAVILGVPFGEAVSFGEGAEKGPEAIKDCLDLQIELFDRFLQTEPAYEHKIGYEVLSCKGVDAEALSQKVSQEYPKQLTILLGGDHSVLIGVWAALAKEHSPKDVTILQIDAHLDLRYDDSEYNDESPSRFAHSCVMRHAVEKGFPISAVGIRTYAKEEYEFITSPEGSSVSVFEWGRGSTPPVSDIVSSIKTEKVYITIDVDGFDPSVMPATGTPVPGGLSWDYGVQLIQEVIRQRELVGADIVEVAPIENSGQTEYAAAQLCYNILSYALEKKKKGAIDYK